MRKAWVVAALFLALATPRRGDAALGVAAFGGGVPVAGVPLVLLGGLGLYYGLPILAAGWEYHCDRTTLAALGCFFGGVITGLGVILLDEETGLPRFQELDADSISTLELTDQEADAYSERLPEINAAAETVAATLAEEMPPDKRLSKRAAKRWVKRSAELWEDQRPLLGDEAFAALGKIVSN